MRTRCGAAVNDRDRNGVPKASLTAASTVRKFRDQIGAQFRNLDNGKNTFEKFVRPIVSGASLLFARFLSRSPA
jgi:hypothetical protein